VHVDHGNTTLVDAMLKQSNPLINSLPDFMPYRTELRTG
jgi:hypothetical protein